MENLVPFINEFQEILSKSNYPSSSIQLPQIIVIGNQSSGKSSLLEAIIGQELLPKGTGIVTRRPIVIQLFNKKEADNMYAEFVHRKGRIYTEFSEVRQEIEAETQRVAGNSKGISAVPIVLKIFSSKLVNLSLVDLPGLAKVPIGDQPHDIEEKIRGLVEYYIENPNSLILCVLPANVDIANSYALKLSRRVDPEGKRTIGVLTKLDLMEEGTSACDLLEGRVYPLKLGFHGVICRSQNQISQGCTLTDGQSNEMKFFSQIPDYQLLEENLGVQKLTVKLNALLVRKVKQFLPGVRSKVYSLLQRNEAELRHLGHGLFSEEKTDTKKAVLLTIITKFSRNLGDLVKGRIQVSRQNELVGGARINFIFNEVFRKAISLTDPFLYLNDVDIRAAVKNANGMNPSLLVSEDAFKLLVKEQIRRLEQPSLECAQLIYEELKRIIYLITLPELQRFRKLNGEMNAILESMLSHLMIPTQAMIRNIIEVELGYINTRHPDFIIGAKDQIGGRDEGAEEGGGRETSMEEARRASEQEELSKSCYSFDVSVDGRVIPRDLHTMTPMKRNMPVLTQLERLPEQLVINKKPSKREKNEVALIKQMIFSYFEVVKKNINDIIPKTIITFLINKVNYFI